MKRGRQGRKWRWYYAIYQAYKFSNSREGFDRITVVKLLGWGKRFDMPKRFDSEEERRRYFREKQALAREKKKNLGKDLPAVSVLTESQIPTVETGPLPSLGEGGEVRESTVERPKVSEKSDSSNSGTNPVRHAVNSRDSGDSRGGGQRPSYIPEKEWVLACERAERVRRYAGKFPQFVKTSEIVYQDPVWQWENEVRGRFGGVVGGSLSGTRGERI